MRKSSAGRTAAVLASGLLLILVAVYFSLTYGNFEMSVKDIVKTLLRIDPQSEYDLVVFEFRLPRIVLGACIGFALGIAGCVLQGITRNGLADPGVLGINAGAGMAVVLFMFLFQGTVNLTGWLGVMTMPLFGLAGGFAALTAIYSFARQGGRLDPQRLILVGIAMGTGFGAVTMYVSLKMNPQDYEMAAVWLSGSLHGANWKFVAAMLPWLLIIPLVIWLRSSVLDLLQLGEENAKGLGVALEREKNLLLLCSIGLISASVAFAGAIAFVGLIAPHLARQLVGLQHKHILPVSGLIGIAMLVIGDLIGKTVFAPAELAVGVVISILGVPYFVYLLIRNRK
ncbi:iron ABC transporter permease [Paenibacillus faecis]|uniref:FecCD family ABC transporter permease n=1 Tax=Paenibacillus faecis TaxID=862114 RepID=UPI001B2F4715|nr:iron ABC transporter permease [Paenibacillus faecis]GIO84452.1 iron ABC transporter permease [Paenibacillus faecis]